MQTPFAGWALARLLPASVSQATRDYARSIRRRFALVGLVLAVGLTAFLWDWTANLAVCAVAFVVMVLGLGYYAELAHRTLPHPRPPVDPLDDGA